MQLTIFDLHMTDAGWNKVYQKIPSTAGVYLHYGLFRYNNQEFWIPLRIGKARTFKGRWFLNSGCHKVAFYALQHNNQTFRGRPYQLEYPNYAFFFHELRLHCQTTKLCLLEVSAAESQPKESIESHLISSLNPLWEYDYKYKQRMVNGELVPCYDWVILFEQAAKKWMQRFQHRSIRNDQNISFETQLVGQLNDLGITAGQKEIPQEREESLSSSSMEDECFDLTDVHLPTTRVESPTTSLPHDSSFPVLSADWWHNPSLSGIADSPNMNILRIRQKPESPWLCLFKTTSSQNLRHRWFNAQSGHFKHWAARQAYRNATDYPGWKQFFYALDGLLRDGFEADLVTNESWCDLILIKQPGRVSHRWTKEKLKNLYLRALL